MSSRTGTTKIGYVNKTALSEDFRTLLVPKPKLPAPKLVVDYCPICLNEFVDPRSLPCYHTFCRRCLQYAIDKALPNTDQDRGFMCILCGFFVKVPDYSIPRAEWAGQIPAGVNKQDEVTADEENKSVDTDTYSFLVAQKDREVTKDWILDWQLSTYSKSDCLQRGLDPYKRTKKGFPFIKNLKVTDKDVSEESDDDEEMENTESNTETAGENRDDQDTGEDIRQSKVTAVTYYNDEIIVYDQGLSEVIIYNPDVTIKTCLTAQKVFGLAVLDDILYMTNPQELCIDVIDLRTMAPKPSINITMKCYGITSLGEELAVLLWDVNDQNLHICFLDDCCVTGGYIALSTGSFGFKNPRKLAGCPRTRLLYVSDSEAGLVKCFRPDGKLKWEKVVYDAGDISVFNCYVIIARRFTNSIDVLSERGSFVGRLQSEDYGLISPSVLSANTETTKLVISDHDQMLHVFKIRTKIVNSIQKKSDPKCCAKGSCACTVF